MKISASYLGIKEDLENNLIKLNNTDIDYIHVDIMDGIFVQNKNNTSLELLEKLGKKLDIHLMVEDVFKYVDIYSKLNPEYITFHYELNCDIMKVVNYLKSKNIKVGISIKPDTKVERIKDYLPFIDLVLLMSVEPGKGGQQFIDITDKIKELKEYKYNFLIEVDGGINDLNIKDLDIDIAVVGSFITNGDYQVQINKLKEVIYG